MAFNRPTLDELVERVEAEIKGIIGVTNIIRRQFLYVLARVIAGVAHLWHGALEYNSRQFLPTTMDEQNLIAYGGIWGIARNEAQAGVYTASGTGTNGTVIPANTIFIRSDGAEYFTQDEETIAGGVVTLTLVAEDAGTDSELSVSDVVTIQNPIAGLDSEVTIASVVTEPEDLESIASYRQRIIFRIQNPISGGTATDYIQWALEVAGVTRAWVLPQQLGPGTVSVTFVEDNEDPITPSGAKVTEVADYIEERRPVTADVTVFAPTLFPIDMTIELKPNTTDVQNAVTAELEDLILRDAALAGAYKTAEETHDGKILLSRINEAISIAVGEEDHNITLINGSSPADVTPPTNNLAVLGTITWQPLA